MEPGLPSLLSRAGRRLARALPWLLPAAPVAGAALLAAGGVSLAWFGAHPLGLLLLAVEGALLTVAGLALYLAAHARVTGRAGLVLQLERELRHLRGWDADEGLLRKAGLIRDLNALGVAPRDLAQAVLSGADLTGCDLRGTCLRGANLRHANLQGALLDGADLTDADCSEANLALARLAGVSARGVNLEGASLAKTHLAGANLSRANLVNANLHGTDLHDVALDRARFAESGPGGFAQTPHPSVDDWIRERLDARGCYNPDGHGHPPTNAAPKTRKISSG